jgi:tetratricopeptide (TPR) repeat protein
MHQDYILRMVQQFSGFLVRVMRLRKEGKTEEALAVLADAYGALVGLPESLVHALSDDDLIALLRSQGRLDPERCLGLAELLREEARVYDDVERFDESFPRNLKALRLYLELLDEDDELISDRVPGLCEVIKDLSGFDLPDATADRLVAYLEESGQFDEAENVLLQRLENAPLDTETARSAAAFYQRLLKRSDAELIVGGLTRDEVEEASRRFD